MYDRLEQRFAALDARKLTYRFDIERDFDWQRTDVRRLRFSLGMLERIGVDVDVFEGRDDVRAAFDWGTALGVCRMFSFFEQSVVEFIELEAKHFANVQSLVYLAEEERKHMALFDRYAALLLAERPEWATLGETATKTTLAPLVEHFRAMPGIEGHYCFWANTIFFEELTIAMDEYMRAFDDASLDPLWKKMHFLHRREETQHVLTDNECLGALEGVDPVVRQTLSQRMVLGIVVGDYWNYWGVAAGAFVANALFPNLPPLLGGESTTERGGFHDFLKSPTFRRSRKALPYLDILSASID